MSLLVILSYTASDALLAAGMLSWAKELGGCPARDCLLVEDCKMNEAERAPVRAGAKAVFAKVSATSTPFKLPDEKWPLGPNHMFETGLRAALSLKRDFLWLEPDCVPMRRDWMEVVEAAWVKCQQPFMGQVIETGKPGLPPKMMSGVGCYRADGLKKLLPLVVQQKAKKAFDVALAGLTTPACQHSRLFWNFYGERELPPTFGRQRVANSPGNLLLLSSIPRPTLLFHRCKDGSLTRLLKEDLAKGLEWPGEKAKTAVPAPIPAQPPTKQASQPPPAPLPLPLALAARAGDSSPFPPGFKHNTRKPKMIVLGEQAAGGRK